MSWSRMSDSAFCIVMGCMPSGPAVLKGLKLLITNFVFQIWKFYLLLRRVLHDHCSRCLLVLLFLLVQNPENGYPAGDSEMLFHCLSMNLVNRQDGCVLPLEWLFPWLWIVLAASLLVYRKTHIVEVFLVLELGSLELLFIGLWNDAVLKLQWKYMSEI